MTRQNKNLRIIFIAALGFLLLLTVITYTRLTSLIESGQLVNHTTQVTLELEKSIGNLKDAETGHRGFLLTHDERFLKSFKTGLQENPVHLQNLSELIKDNPVQQKNLQIVKNLIERREAYMYKMLEVDKVRKPTAEEMLVGKDIMDSLQSKVNVMLNIENILTKQRTLRL